MVGSRLWDQGCRIEVVGSRLWDRGGGGDSGGDCP